MAEKQIAVRPLFFAALISCDHTNHLAATSPLPPFTAVHRPPSASPPLHLSTSPAIPSTPRFAWDSTRQSTREVRGLRDRGEKEAQAKQSLRGELDAKTQLLDAKTSELTKANETLYVSV